MQEEQSIEAHLLKVDEVVNSLKGLGEKLEDKVVVPKILRSLPFRFDAKVLLIEEMSELDKLTVDKLHKILTTYEMRTSVEASSKREIAFKVLNKGNKKSLASSDSEEAYFARKSKKNSNKFKIKLSLNCFNCGKKGHFSSKCPNEKEDDSSYENDHKNNKKSLKKGKKFLPFQKKSLFERGKYLM